MGANLKDVKERIGSVKNTKQITKAMKMVSAAKLRRAQDAITQLRPYSAKLNEILVNILASLEGDASSNFSEERDVNSVLFFIVTSNRGLAGAFNANVIKAAVKKIEEEYSELKNSGLTLVPIGKKGRDYFVKHYPETRIVEDYVTLFDDLSFGNVSKVSDTVMDRFLSERYDVVDVAYAEFKNAAAQNFRVETYLPVSTLDSEEEVSESDTSNTRADYIFEPEKQALLNKLIPSILQIKFQRYLLDTHASEHGARMTAMDKATENADELIKELKITYNKARQEAITREISEIVGGAAALEGA